jgi:hypothetical protein
MVSENPPAFQLLDPTFCRGWVNFVAATDIE